MSFSGLQFALNETFSQESLKVHYDFSHDHLTVIEDGLLRLGSLQNRAPNSSGEGDGIIGNAVGINSGLAITATTGSNRFLETNGSGNFSKSSVKINGDSRCPANSCSAIFSFAYTGSLYDGVLFGSLKKNTDVYNGVSYDSSEGFNFGITSRGHLFFHTFSDKGDSIQVATEIELAKKNIVSFSVGGGEVEIARYDYLNQEIQSQSFPIKTSLVLNSDSIYLGASPTYYRTASGITNFSGFMDDFLLFSGKKSSEVLYDIGEGLIGDYYFNSGSVSGFNVTTGYLDVPIYKYWTGITGYSNIITGYELIPSGVPVYTTTTGITGSTTTNEGSPYWITGTASGAFFLEQQGYLNPALFGTYEPTGDSAHATLGLQAGSISTSLYEVSVDYVQQYISMPMYFSSGLTGTMSGISGYSRTPLTETQYITGQPTSGLLFSEDAGLYKKDYLYYLGPR